MKTRDKKIASAFLLVLTMAPLFYSMTFQMRQQQIRRRMKEQLEERMLHSITLNINDLHWVREGKEIALGDQLFDVKSMVYNKDGKVTVTGLYDDEESLLVQQLKETQKKNQERSTRQLVHLFQLMQAQPGNPLQDHSDAGLLIGLQFPDRESPLADAFETIPTPPPQA